MSSSGLWLRWSLRDLRSRWPLVMAISLVIAIGTGMFTGLGSMETWRTSSNDESFALLNAHDLKVTLPEGGFAAAGRLEQAVRSAGEDLGVSGAEERLVVPTQVDASRPGHSVLVPGELVGIDLRHAGPTIDAVHSSRGRGLRAGDSRRAVAVVESGFAGQADLPVGGTIQIAGGRRLATVGHGTSPDYFLVTRPGGGEFGGAEARYAVLFVPLRVAQAASDRRGAVNRLLVTLRPGVDPDRAAGALRDTLDRRAPELGATVETLADEPAHRVLYRDADGDQRIYGVFAWLILLGAAFAAFNLASRIVEAQRREIGVGMALGVEPRRLAMRPLLLGAEIALLGALLGLVLGLLVRAPLRMALEDLLPLPVIVTPFEPDVFVRGALLGFLLPLAATMLPVWRAVRVQPIEAIRLGFRSAKGTGLAPLLRRLRLPGGSLGQMPVRNVVRAPRRTFMTVAGIAAVIAVLVAMLGLIDSFLRTVDRSQAELAGATPSRLEVTMDAFRARGSPVIRSVVEDPTVGAAEPRIAVAASVGSGGTSFDVGLQLTDSGSRIWRPTVTRGSYDRAGGILLADEAARDLDVGPGDLVRLRHPRRIGPTAFETVTTRMRVAGTHPDPFRTVAYMDAGQAARFGLEGRANRVHVLPAAGSTEDDVQRALFADPGVRSVEAVTANTEVMRDRMDEFVGVLRVIEAFTLALALLMAFNSSSISADERAREHATMFAFGVPVPAAVRLAVGEGLLMGVAATAAGVAGGLLLTTWMIRAVVPDTFPDLGMVVSLGGGSLAAAILLGTAAVALAPLFTARRMRRMDVPSTLRVVE
jgi:putative ABC transport system permease protein